MFVLPAIAFVGGLVAMGRRAPKTAVRKLLCLGPRSGIVYPVEDFPEIGTVVVRAPGDRAIAQFLRAAVREPGKPGLIYQHGQGDAQLLELIRRDFGVPVAKPAAVPAEGSKEPTPSPRTTPGAPVQGASPENAAPAAPAPKAQQTGRSTP